MSNEKPTKYKFNIYVNQFAIIEYDLKIDFIEAAIFGMLEKFAHKKKCNKMMDNGLVWYKFNWKIIPQQLPTLGIKGRTACYNRMKSLCGAGMLIAHENNQQNRASWYTFGENAEKYNTVHQREHTVHQNEPKPKDSVHQNEHSVREDKHSTVHQHEHDNYTNNNYTNNNDKKRIAELEKQLEELSKKPKTPKFIPPTLEQVLEYCEKQNVRSDFAQAFIDYNINIDWKIKSTGKKMKDWKAAFRTSLRQEWHQKYKLKTPPPKTTEKKHTETDYKKLFTRIKNLAAAEAESKAKWDERPVEGKKVLVVFEKLEPNPLAKQTWEWAVNTNLKNQYAEHYETAKKKLKWND